MPNPRIIRARINPATHEVFFTPAAGVASGLTFHAGRRDTLVWQLIGGAGLTATVTFGPAPPSPVVGGGPLTSNGDTITGTIRGDAVLGEYNYKFEIVGPGVPLASLKCIWQSEGGGTLPIDMGGGVITDPPPA